MKEELIKFETAKLAKEKGFDEPAYFLYRKGRVYDIFSPEIINSVKKSVIAAPTQSLLQKWLREVHKIDMWVEKYNDDIRFFYQCPKVHDNDTDRRLNHWADTYEDALEAGLLEALKLIEDGG